MALFFFVVLANYVVPYFLTVSVMSAKWLLELEGSKDIIC